MATSVTTTVAGCVMTTAPIPPVKNATMAAAWRLVTRHGSGDIEG